MNWESLVFLGIASFALSYSGYRFQRLFQLMKQQKGQHSKIDRIPERFQALFIDVLGQRAVLKSRAPGIMHTIIFWGFLIISLGTLEQFISTVSPSSNFEWIGELPYQILVLLQDLFTFGVLGAVGYAAYRRYIIRPEGLGQSADANRILMLTATLMISILLMNAFAILGETNPWMDWMPISQTLAHLFSSFSLDPQMSLNLSHGFKWTHMLLVLGFAMYIPNSKHLHVVAAGPNTFLKTLSREKPMKTISFEDESITQYGAAKITDLSWKDVLDFYACTECGRCQDLCPAYQTKKPLSPKKIIYDLKNQLFRNQHQIIEKRTDDLEPILDHQVTENVIWACTSCRACEIACPVFIEHTDKIYDIRRNLVMMESKFPVEVQPVFKNMENNATPWAFSASDRDQWAKDLSVKTLQENPRPDILLWVGCAGSYDDRNKKVVRAFVSVLKKANVSFAILGNEEKCTGDPARRIGNEYLYQTLAKANIETLNRYQVKTIVTACPHCFNTLKNEYPALGGHYEVFHHSQWIAKLIRDGKIKPTKNIEETITFHDSCYLGRWNSVYEPPRQILQSLPAARIVEIPQFNHEKSFCCGAGGGRMWMEETLGKRINLQRTEQALETNASIVAASCPFCITMLSDGVKSKEMSDKIKVMDISELIDQSSTSVSP